MDSESWKKTVNLLIIALNGSSALLVLGSLFLVEIFSVIYGLSNGIAVQSGYSGVAVANALQGLVSQSVYLHDGILESYVLTIVALMLLETSFMLFLRRNERASGGSRRYVAMHTGFGFIYALIFAIVFIDSASYLNEIYLWAIYIGIAATLSIGIALNYVIRLPGGHSTGMRRSIKVDPGRPFSNMMELRDQIFGNMHGDIKVVDKHFNSVALSNFHRLVIDNIKQFKSVTIITSTEMMDTNFGKNVSDFRREMESDNVKFDLRFMDEGDKVEQHERIILDDAVAYKIPPFNIINNRSEHIIMIGHSEAHKRFDYLYRRAISFQNYSIKQARNPETKGA